jgi:hypothetical protein
MRNALAAGFIGAATTNVLHEAVRRTVPNAPRVDLLGMQALSKMLGLGMRAPSGDALYAATLVGDLLSNSAYFASVRLAPRRHAVKCGLLLGLLAGIGAITLPGPLGLNEEMTARTEATKWLTVTLYSAGGLATGLAFRHA